MAQGRKKSFLRVISPLIMAACCFISILFPPLFIVLPMLAMWLDIRNDSVAATIGMGIASGFLLGISFGLAGIAAALFLTAPAVTGRILMKRGKPFNEGALPMLAVSFVMMVLFAASLFAVFGNDVVGSFIELLKQGLAETESSALDSFLAAFAGYLNYMTSEAQPEFKDAVEAAMAMSRSEILDLVLPYLEEVIRVCLPGLLLKITLLAGGGTWIAGGYLVKASHKKGNTPEWLKEDALPKSLGTLSIPGWVSGPLILLLFLAWILQLVGSDTLLAAAYAAEQVAQTVFLLQGLAIVAWFTSKKHWPMPLRAIVMIAGSLFAEGEIMYVLGMADSIFHFRRFAAMKAALNERMKASGFKMPDEPEEPGKDPKEEPSDENETKDDSDKEEHK